MTDAFGNAFVERAIGLYKIEARRDDSPLRTGRCGNQLTLGTQRPAWIAWYKRPRRDAPARLQTPVEFQAGSQACPP